MIRASIPGLIIVATLLSAATVLAQEPTATTPRPAEITNPDWMSWPTETEFASEYPVRANRAGRSGHVVLLCIVDEQGLLTQCKIDEETPKSWGFGAAAMSLAGKFRMRPRTRDGVPVGDAKVIVPIDFTPAPRVIEAPRWLALPTPADIHAALPASALGAGKDGRVDLACTLGSQGQLLDCSVYDEAPSGYGFAAAAMSLAGKFRLALAAQQPGDRVLVPVPFPAK